MRLWRQDSGPERMEDYRAQRNFQPCRELKGSQVVGQFEKSGPQGLKPIDSVGFTARLKPCPDTKLEFFCSV